MNPSHHGEIHKTAFRSLNLPLGGRGVAESGILPKWLCPRPHEPNALPDHMTLSPATPISIKARQLLQTH